MGRAAAVEAAGGRRPGASPATRPTDARQRTRDKGQRHRHMSREAVAPQPPRDRHRARRDGDTHTQRRDTETHRTDKERRRGGQYQIDLRRAVRSKTYVRGRRMGPKQRAKQSGTQHDTEKHNTTQRSTALHCTTRHRGTHRAQETVEKSMHTAGAVRWG